MDTRIAKAPLVRVGAVLLTAALVSACGEDTTFTFPPADEILQVELFDLLEGPIDRASAYDVVAGQGSGVPRAVRVDQTEAWDVVFAMLEGSPVWLPRGFFDGFDETSGVLLLEGTFDEITGVPSDPTLYEEGDPVAIEVGRTYSIRSRTDPGLTFPCRIYGKVEVLSVEGDPALLRFRVYWNPNCDDTNVDTRNLDESTS